MMLLYSALLAVGLVVSAPWWVARMLTTERYREGIRERLGRVPERLRAAVAGFVSRDGKRSRVVWVHAVSVGEVLAASRLIGELEAALSAGGEAWRVVVSTTTRTGQALGRERFGAERVFYFPLDFAWAVRAYMRVLRPAALVLMESEVWPRVLWECRRVGVPVVVVNARVSDRSFARGMKVRRVWGRVLAMVSLWLAQSEEDAKRLVAMGARAGSVRAIGNLKYDIATRVTGAVELLRPLLQRRTVLVGGSLLNPEERVLIDLLLSIRNQAALELVLLLAPRHPERFASVISSVPPWLTVYRMTELRTQQQGKQPLERFRPLSVVILDTIGDLAGVYSLADIAFVGGSLAHHGGHNPLEPARFGVPVVMGPSFENFRDVVAKMQAADAIRIVGRSEKQIPDTYVVDELQRTFVNLLTDRGAAEAMGQRGKKVFEEQQGATARAVVAIVEMVRGGAAR